MEYGGVGEERKEKKNKLGARLSEIVNKRKPFCKSSSINKVSPHFNSGSFYTPIVEEDHLLALNLLPDPGGRGKQTIKAVITVQSDKCFREETEKSSNRTDTWPDVPSTLYGPYPWMFITTEVGVHIGLILPMRKVRPSTGSSQGVEMSFPQAGSHLPLCTLWLDSREHRTAAHRPTRDRDKASQRREHRPTHGMEAKAER